MKPAGGAGVVADLQTSLYGVGFHPRAKHKSRRLAAAPQSVPEDLVRVRRDGEVPGLSQRTYSKLRTRTPKALRGTCFIRVQRAPTPCALLPQAVSCIVQSGGGRRHAGRTAQATPGT